MALTTWCCMALQLVSATLHRWMRIVNYWSNFIFHVNSWQHFQGPARQHNWNCITNCRLISCGNSTYTSTAARPNKSQQRSAWATYGAMTQQKSFFSLADAGSKLFSLKNFPFSLQNETASKAHDILASICDRISQCRTALFECVLHLQQPPEKGKTWPTRNLSYVEQTQSIRTICNVFFWIFATRACKLHILGTV